MKETQTPQTWTLWDRDLILTTGQFIEYQEQYQVLVVCVERVRVISVPAYKDTQVIDVRLYGKLTRSDGRRERSVQPKKVLRTLDAPPPPVAKALASLWSPRSPENPFRVVSTLTNDEWKLIALWYPFSIRVFAVRDGLGQWHEQARTRAWHEAKEAMISLARLHQEKSLLFPLPASRPYHLCYTRVAPKSNLVGARYSE